MKRTVAYLASVLLVVGASQEASAYKLFGPYLWGEGPDTYYEKWGDIFTTGEPAGTITWSIMPDGTAIDPSFSNPFFDFSGTSNLQAIMTTLGYAQAEATIERVLAKWSAAANVYFERVPDSGAPYNGDDADPPNTGEIRFGAFATANKDGSPSSTGGITFAPWPYARSSEADVILNSNNTFFFDPGGEGDPIQIFNDFESLLLHEVGHALGLDHSETQAVMSADFNIFQYVNRELDPDDIAAIQFLYGPPVKSDFDHDNYATADDLAIWGSHYGDTGATQPAGDATDDGLVSGADLLVWQREFGPPPSPATAVPEPASLVLAALAVAAAIARARLSLAA